MNAVSRILLHVASIAPFRRTPLHHYGLGKWLRSFWPRKLRVRRPLRRQRRAAHPPHQRVFGDDRGTEANLTPAARLDRYYAAPVGKPPERERDVALYHSQDESMCLKVCRSCATDLEAAGSPCPGCMRPFTRILKIYK